MGDLKAHRKGWDVAERIRSDELAALTPQEALHQFGRLFSEFAPLLKATEELFRPERVAYLAQFQERLRRLPSRQKTPK